MEELSRDAAGTLLRWGGWLGLLCIALALAIVVLAIAVRTLWRHAADNHKQCEADYRDLLKESLRIVADLKVALDGAIRRLQ